jgi:ferredoxin
LGKTKIKIDYSICGDGNKIDPRECAICLKVCDPALFLLHQAIGKKQNSSNPYDPQIWRVTPVYPSLCTHCMKCVEQCPEQVIVIKW